MGPATRLVWLETPTNPLLKIADIAAVARLARATRPDAWVGVDNTFASPYLQQPLQLGADFVVHSLRAYFIRRGDHNELANGFDDVQIYDPATGAWTASGAGSSAPLPLPQARGGMGKAVFDGGEFWVFGGETLDGPGATGKGVYDRVDIYDPVSNRWRAGPPMPTGRHGIFPVLVGDRIYVVAGGVHSSTSASRVAEVLDLRAPGARRLR